MFVPEKINDHLLEDTELIERIPVSVGKYLEVDIVIAVDVTPIKVNGEITSIYGVIMQHELVINR